MKSELGGVGSALREMKGWQEECNKKGLQPVMMLSFGSYVLYFDAALPWRPKRWRSQIGARLITLGAKIMGLNTEVGRLLEV